MSDARNVSTGDMPSADEIQALLNKYQIHQSDLLPPNAAVFVHPEVYKQMIRPMDAPIRFEQEQRERALHDIKIRFGDMVFKPTYSPLMHTMIDPGEIETYTLPLPPPRKMRAVDYAAVAACAAVLLITLVGLMV